jgi:branched-chain amino acid transport system permease protein
VTAGVAARFCYGAAIVGLLLVEPGGLAALARRVRLRLAGPPRRSHRAAPAAAAVDVADAVDVRDDVAPATPSP